MNGDFRRPFSSKLLASTLLSGTPFLSVMTRCTTVRPLSNGVSCAETSAEGSA